MNRFFGLALSLALAFSAVTAYAAESRTDAEVRVLAREIVAEARGAAFYPAAFDKEGFPNFYSTFHVVARKLRGDPPMVAADYDQVMLLKERLAGLKQIVADPASTVWKIWGDTIPVEDMAGTDWDHSYDNEGFEPFLNPFLLGKCSKNPIEVGVSRFLAVWYPWILLKEGAMSPQKKRRPPCRSSQCRHS